MDAMLTEVTEMNAAVLYGQEDVRIERVPMPRPERGEIVVEVQAALTCGTDLKTYRRGYHARMLALPALFGHELAGVVREVGAGVSQFEPGMRVVALTPRLAANASGASANRRTSARICCSTTAPTPSTSAFRRASSRRTP